MTNLNTSDKATLYLAALGDRIIARAKRAEKIDIAAIVEDEVLRATPLSESDSDLYGLADMTAKLFTFGMKVVERVDQAVMDCVFDLARSEIARASPTYAADLVTLKARSAKT